MNANVCTIKTCGELTINIHRSTNKIHTIFQEYAM